MRLGGICQRGSKAFLRLLGHVHRGHYSKRILRTLGHQCVPGFMPSGRRKCVHLIARGCRTRQVGSRRLRRLPKHSCTFHTGVSKGFPRCSCPASRMLRLGHNTRMVFIGGSASNRRHCCGNVVKRIATISTSKVRIHDGKDSTAFLLRRRR